MAGDEETGESEGAPGAEAEVATGVDSAFVKALVAIDGVEGVAAFEDVVGLLALAEEEEGGIEVLGLAREGWRRVVGGGACWLGRMG